VWRLDPDRLGGGLRPLEDRSPLCASQAQGPGPAEAGDLSPGCGKGAHRQVGLEACGRALARVRRTSPLAARDPRVARALEIPGVALARLCNTWGGGQSSLRSEGGSVPLRALRARAVLLPAGESGQIEALSADFGGV